MGSHLHTPSPSQVSGPPTIHRATGAGIVVGEGLVVVLVIRPVVGVHGHLEARWAVLDQDHELLINQSSGRLHREADAALVSVHPEAATER